MATVFRRDGKFSSSCVSSPLKATLKELKSVYWRFTHFHDDRKSRAVSMRRLNLFVIVATGIAVVRTVLSLLLRNTAPIGALCDFDLYTSSPHQP